jgi:predicted Zn-dependent protease
MGRDADAEGVMEEAVAMADAPVMGIHQYGASLIAAGKKDKAMAIFRMNRERHPDDTFVTYVGLARGYTAIGDTKNAIANWGNRAQELPGESEAEPAGVRASAEGERRRLRSRRHLSLGAET